MNVLVTGAAGYLGSVLVPELLARNNKVTVLDNFMFQQTSLLDVAWNPNLKIVRGDVRDHGLVSKLMADADLIIPLACLTGAPLCTKDPETATAVNRDAIRFIAENKSSDQRLIYPTTNSGYGIGQADVYCDENTPLRPISLYGRLKVEAEDAVLAAQNSLTFRLATVFGTSPRMRLDLLVNDFTYRAVNDRFLVLFEAHFKRNYVHVRDVARAFLHAIDHFDTMKGEPYNVGLSSANLSKFELCQEIKKHVPDFYFVEASIGEDPDKRNYIVSNEKIERTGFETKFDLNTGIKELIKGFQIIKRQQYANV